MPTVLDAASSGSRASHWRSTGWRPAGRCRDLRVAVDAARPVHHGGKRNDMIEWEAQATNTRSGTTSEHLTYRSSRSTSHIIANGCGSPQGTSCSPGNDVVCVTGTVDAFVLAEQVEAPVVVEVAVGANDA